MRLGRSNISFAPDDEDFRQYFQSFLESVYRTHFPPSKFLRPVDLKLNAETAHQESMRRTVFFENELGAWIEDETRTAFQAEFDQLHQKAAEMAATVPDMDLVQEMRTYRIVESEAVPQKKSSDIVRIKINHGYWEQLLAIYLRRYDPEVIRINSRYRYLEDYQLSGFNDALNYLFSEMGQVVQGELQFPDVELGFSFGNGDLSHQDILEETKITQTKPNLKRTIRRGVLLGSRLTFSTLHECQKFCFHDGSWAKISLNNGELEQTMTESAKYSDNIVFVVPPHLKDIRLNTGTRTPTQNLYISGSRVHKSWIHSLLRTSNLIYSGLKEGRTITVITQSAVFSAILGLFLKKMKDDLKLKGRLFYFDLGQVLDVANPDSGGLWAKYAQGKKLFYCEDEEK